MLPKGINKKTVSCATKLPGVPTKVRLKSCSSSNFLMLFQRLHEKSGHKFSPSTKRLHRQTPPSSSNQILQTHSKSRTLDTNPALQSHPQIIPPTQFTTSRPQPQTIPNHRLAIQNHKKRQSSKRCRKCHNAIPQRGSSTTTINEKLPCYDRHSSP